jgi:hypothetical protein
MSRAPSILLALAACGLRPYDVDATGGTTTGVSSSTASTSTASTTTPTTTGADATASSSTSTSSATGSSTGAGFIVPMDGGGGIMGCDLLVQDCPEGHKCNLASLDGDSAWESMICVPLHPDPDGLYEPCTMTGAPYSGQDTCGKSLTCTQFDPNTGIGECWGLCSGTFEDLMCEDPMAWCYARAGIALCFPHCNPLYQACGAGESCLPDPMNPDTFVCLLDASGEQGQAFDPCDAVNECDPGLFCAGSALAKECDAMASGCCLPFCDLVDPQGCPGVDQQCLPFYERGMVPPDYWQVGLCGLPP